MVALYQKIEKVLSDIHLRNQPLWDIMRLQHASLEEGKLLLILESPTPQPQDLEARIVSILEKEEGIDSVSLVFTTERKAPSQTSSSKESAPNPALPPNIKAVLGVASAKGGVGKSTIAANLALAFSKLGKKVGVLDADIHGPSQHILFGLENVRSKELAPTQAHGIALMSMGQMIDRDTPIIWRGPMVGKALKQMSVDTEWGMLDILVIDFPPGTGDVPLSFSRLLPLAGVVLVSTPQKLALADTRRGLVMFQKMNVPILGIVENMSGFICPHCNEISDIFTGEEMEDTARIFKTEILGKIPLTPLLNIAADEGTPFIIKYPKGPLSDNLMAIAEKISQLMGV